MVKKSLNILIVLLSIAGFFISASTFILGQDQLGVITRKLPGERMRNSSGLFDPESNADAFRIEPGETVILAELEGPGELQHIWFTIGARDRRYPRSLVFRIFWDEAEIPSVESPLGDFFAAGHGMRANVHTLPIEVTSHGRALNSYWKMPFKKKAKLTMTNESDKRITSCYFYIDWVKLDDLPPNSLYFHARYSQEWPVKPFSPYTLLEVEGDGQYVGTIMNLHSSVGSWFGESDDRFYVDGEQIPRLVGTGFEDYFTDAWNLRMYSNLNAGVTIREWDAEDSRITCYRWHIQDPIMFKKSLKVDIERRSYVELKNEKTGEVRHGNFKYRSDFCSSVAFWYQRTVAKPWKPFPPLIQRVSEEIWVIPKEMVANPKERSRIKVSPGLTPSRRHLRPNGNYLSFYMFNDKAGSWLEIPFTLEKEGRYSISVFQVLFKEYGIWKISLRREGLNKLLDPRVDFWDPYLVWKENYPRNEVFGTTIENKVGILNLKPGQYVLRFECIGTNPQSFDEKTGKNGYSIGLDSISIRKLPWRDMNEWYDDYLVKEKKLFEKRILAAKKTVAELAEAIEKFKSDYGRYPESLDMLVERPAEMNRGWALKPGKWPYIKGNQLPLDPWGQLYRYLVPGRYNPDSFDVWSVQGHSRNPKVWIGNWIAEIE